MRRKLRKSESLTLLLIILQVLVNSAVVSGDALVITKAATASTIAEIFVEQEEVRVELEVGEEDQAALREFLPHGDEAEPLSEEERIGQLFRDQFVIKTDSGDRLECVEVQVASGQRLARDEITGAPLAEQPDGREQIVSVMLHFRLALKPASIRITPPLRPGTDYVLASIGFVTYHQGLPVNNFRYLATEVTLDLDWEDPWYSRFRHRNLWRQYDAPMSVFLYVEPYEVRKEIVLRPRDLQHWVDLGLEGTQRIEVAQQAALKKRVGEFLARHGRVKIDGEIVEGQLDRIHFIYRSLKTSGIIEPAVDLDVNTATLGVIFVYPIEQLPEEVSLEWDLFNSRIQSIPAVSSDEAGGLPSAVTPADPTLQWTNYLTNPTVPSMRKVALPPEPRQFSIPVLAAVCAWTAMLLIFSMVRQQSRQSHISQFTWLTCVTLLVVGFLSKDFLRVKFPDPLAKPPLLVEVESQQLLTDLLFNVYRAFDHHDESLVYDRLEASISGDLLEEVYLETRKSMEVRNQGGLRITVKDVAVRELEQLNDDALQPQFQCRWRVSGSIGHWGHIHRRENEHVALITLAAINGHWKIAAMERLDEETLDGGMSGESREDSDPS